MKKTCKVCGEKKSLNEYHLIIRKAKEYRAGTCKKCRLERNSKLRRSRIKENAEIQKRISESRKLKYQSDPEFREHLKRINSKYLSTGNGKRKAAERGKAWLKSSKGREWRKKWEKESEAGKRARKAVMKRWLSTPSGKEYKARHSAKRRGAVKSAGSAVTAAEWNDLLCLYDYRCAYCGESFSETNPATRDHVIPVSRGGDHEIGNLRPACRRCNSKKNNRDLAPVIQIRKATA